MDNDTPPELNQFMAGDRVMLILAESESPLTVREITKRLSEKLGPQKSANVTAALRYLKRLGRSDFQRPGLAHFVTDTGRQYVEEVLKKRPEYHARRIANQYLETSITIAVLAAQEHCDYDAMARILRRAGVEIRPNWSYRSGRKLQRQNSARPSWAKDLETARDPLVLFMFDANRQVTMREIAKGLPELCDIYLRRLINHLVACGIMARVPRSGTHPMYYRLTDLGAREAQAIKDAGMPRSRHDQEPIVTPAQVAEWVRLCQAGQSVAEIAAGSDCAVETVRYHLTGRPSVDSPAVMLSLPIADVDLDQRILMWLYAEGRQARADHIAGGASTSISFALERLAAFTCEGLVENVQGDGRYKVVRLTDSGVASVREWLKGNDKEGSDTEG